MSTLGGEPTSRRAAEDGPAKSSSEAARPSVGIITVNTDGGLFLPEFLESLRHVTYPAFTLVVVDNASRDRSLQTLARLWPEAVVIRNKSNLGFTGASNRGIDYCLKQGFDYILFLNNDIRMEPDFLDLLVDAADERTLTAPKTYLYHHPGRLDDSVGEFNWSRGVWKKRILGSIPTPEFDTPRQIGNANLSCLLVSAAALRDIGPLDENFFVYYDDTDFVRRAYEKSYRVWFRPEAVIYHRKGATIGGPIHPFGLYYLTRNRPYLIHKHTRSRLKLARFWAYYMTGRMARVVIWTLRRRPDLSRAILRGLSDYFRGRMGKTVERDGSVLTVADPGFRLSESQLSEGPIPKA